MWSFFRLLLSSLLFPLEFLENQYRDQLAQGIKLLFGHHNARHFTEITRQPDLKIPCGIIFFLHFSPPCFLPISRTDHTGRASNFFYRLLVLAHSFYNIFLLSAALILANCGAADLFFSPRHVWPLLQRCASAIPKSGSFFVLPAKRRDNLPKKSDASVSTLRLRLSTDSLLFAIAEAPSGLLLCPSEKRVRIGQPVFC